MQVFFSASPAPRARRWVPPLALCPMLHLQASTLFGSSGPLEVNVAAVRAPSNDAFADAKRVGALPYTDAPDLTAATIEDDEPTTCQGLPVQATAWYAFTPQQSGSYRVSRDDAGDPLGVYTGDSLSSFGAGRVLVRADVLPGGGRNDVLPPGGCRRPG